MNQTLARALVFFTSAAVLVIEILAARLLAPYLGVSLEVFTGIIGVILAGISIGAWVGGAAADRGEPSRLLGPLLVSGGLTALAAPLLIDSIGPSLTTGVVSIVFASAVGFFVPAALLSAVPPVVVKIQLASLDETGRVVGSYSAIGTAGAILGTFATGFVLLAAFPTRPIVVVVGVALTLAGLILWSSRGRWALASLGGMGLLVIGLLGFGGPCEYETTYSCAIVEEDSDRPHGRTLVLDRVRNSYVDLSDPTYLEFRYIRLIVDIIEVEAPDGPVDMVSIGGGGFTLPGYIEHTRPDSENIVLEIDAKLVDIGREELTLSDDVEVVVDDARISIGDIPDDHADVVVGDAYSGASVPWHLTTIEFNEEIARILVPDGVYVMNVIDYGELDFIRAEAATLLQVFPSVALLAPPAYLSGAAGGNFILAAAFGELDTSAVESAIRARGGAEHAIEGRALDEFIGDAPILTDDYAPVDQMLGRL
ncbi:MAG TPA: fused MFS/spermidine synthase [Acidimicrobiia bacterium]|nr:fused MFS/spermidine synthase [Acidimicrobiia bacterium]